MLRLLAYVFWNLYYLTQPRSKDFATGFTRISRTCWQRPFRPFIQHNDDGHFWTVRLGDAPSYSQYTRVPVTMHFDQDSCQVTGFDIYDRDLKQHGEEQSRGTKEEGQADG